MLARKSYTGKGLQIGTVYKTRYSRYIDKGLLATRMNGRPGTVYAIRAGGAQSWRSPKGQYLCIGRYILRFA